ncbi:MAG TPA: tetratricopeptide repeat protein [Longimicrobium sp.]|nr:tetratricopeptide repeat protein [Longimicrobium sp.]
MEASSAGRPRKPRRRWKWHVPPALVHGGESLDGVQVLDELPDAMGLLLWETYRDVVVWARTFPEEREGLFTPQAHAARLAELDAAGLDPALAEALRAAAEVVRAPGEADEMEVMAACRAAADWLDARSLLASAVTLATAAATAAPAHAGAAFRVGQLARKRAENARAETWFRRAIGLGRQAKDWTSYSEAFLGLGNLYRQRGNYPAARRFHIRGLRAARRHALRDVQGRALHDLFVISMDTDNGDEMELARAAFRAYGPRHPRLPRLAHDIGMYWLSQGRFTQALEVFRAVLPRLDDVCDKMLVWANTGRASGGAGDRPGYDEAWEQVWTHAGQWDDRPNSPRALLNLAHGAASLRDWTRAERAASTAREVAGRRGEGHVTIEAESLLDSVLRKRSLESAPTAGEAGLADAEDLAEELVRSLRGSVR